MPSLASKLLQCFQQREEQPHLKSHCFIGFDGFTDEIITVVEKRLNAATFEPCKTIEQFGQRILQAKEKSANIELVVRQKKLGGNAPLLTQALLKGGHRIFFAGAIGTPDAVEPLFQPMAEYCEQTLPLCPSAHTDALEFQDGKILLGKMGDLPQIDFDHLLQQMPKAAWEALLNHTDLVATVNWTMLPHMTHLWKTWQSTLLPSLSIQESPRWFFVDLADPSKRSKADLLEALQTLKGFMESYHVVLGLNESEFQQAATVLGISLSSHTKDDVQKGAEKIRSKLQISHVVVHCSRFAIVASETEIVEAEGTYYPQPKITTGAGDHFNAGYCQGLLFGFSLEETLQLAIVCSGFYVREGYPPTMQELAHDLEKQGL